MLIIQYIYIYIHPLFGTTIEQQLNPNEDDYEFVVELEDFKRKIS